jgi:uncharacterized protein
MNSCLYAGWIWHRRHAPRRHAFRYRACVFLIDLDELDTLAAQLSLFAHNRSRVVSFHDTDYLGGGAAPLKTRVIDHLAHEGLDLRGGRVTLLTQCRTFGYVFNPISLYYCRYPDGTPACIVAEVHNTFGDRVLYLLDDRVRASSGSPHITRYIVDKAMHVSPFFSMACTYDFRVSEANDRIGVTILQEERGVHVFDAGLTGQRVPLTSRTLAAMLLQYPLMTARITAGIHWEALKLWTKGLPVFSRSPS